MSDNKWVAALDAALPIATRLYNNFTSRKQKKPVQYKLPQLPKQTTKTSSLGQVLRAPQQKRGRGRQTNRLANSRVSIAKPLPSTFGALVSTSHAFSACQFNNQNGVRMTGRQFLVDVMTPANSNDFRFSVIVNPTPNVYYFDPLTFSGPLGRIGSSFAQYRCTRLIIDYNPLVGTDKAGKLSLGYCPDSAATHAPTDIAINTLPDSIRIAPYQTVSIDVTDLDKSLKYDKSSASSDASERWGIAGSIMVAGAANVSTPTSAFTYGAIYINYDIEFYGLMDASLDPTIDELKERRDNKYQFSRNSRMYSLNRQTVEEESKDCLSFTTVETPKNPSGSQRSLSIGSTKR